MLEAEKVLQLVDVERNSAAGGSAQHQRQQRDPCHPVRTCVRACVCVCVCAQKIPIRRLLGVCSRAARVLAATAIYLFIAHPVQSSATGLVLRRITVRVHCTSTAVPVSPENAQVLLHNQSRHTVNLPFTSEDTQCSSGTHHGRLVPESHVACVGRSADLRRETHGHEGGGGAAI